MSNVPPTETPTSPGDLQAARAKREREDAERKSAGAAAEPLPGDAAPDDEAEDDADVQLSIEGDADLKLSPGGNHKPKEATITLYGGAFTLAKGQFDLGQRVCIVVEGYVDEAGTRLVRDPKTGRVVSAKKKHGLMIDRIAKAELGLLADAPNAKAA